MNRNKAKLLTLAGFSGCLIAVLFLILDIARIADFYYSPLLFFGGGIVLIVFSLAYYTEK